MALVSARFTLLRPIQDKALLIVVRLSGGPLDLVSSISGAQRVTSADSGRRMLTEQPGW